MEPGIIAKARVLLVDDNATNLLVARRMLEKSGYQVTSCDSGELALQKLREQSFDLLLLDCQMPIMDGYETSRRIRSGKSGVLNSKIPIMALTASCYPEDVERCRQAGMNLHLGKPIELEALRSAVANALIQ